MMFSEDGLVKLKTGLTSLNIPFQQSQIDLLINYWSIVEEVNRSMNLTRILGDHAITHHILDAASAIPYIDSAFGPNASLRIIDIGTGCGVPGVVLRILKPNWQVLLLDSLQKKVKFLNKTIEQLDIAESISAIHSRAEDLMKDKQHYGQYDAAISRAVSGLDKILEYSMGFIKSAGIVVAMKGPRVIEELDLLKKSNRKLADKVILQKIDVPFINEERFLAVYRQKA